MIYQGFAYIYDELMQDAPYEQWNDYLLTIISRHGNGGNKLLDLGCGTGELSLKMAGNQFVVTGIDLSGEMLSVAQNKALENKKNILFLQQDMRSMNGFQDPFDVIMICCDSLNYLKSEEDVQDTFQAAYQQLSENGLLIFDVHSLYKIHEIFSGSTFTDQNEEISFIWNSYLGDEPNSIEHDMTFFVKQGTTYQRYDEIHQQRTFSIEQYKTWLEATSLDVLEINSDFEPASSPHSTTERVFFVAKKSI
ncbi:class I SAM-dependent DNA methyltransferase [Metabacillus herbersteinensis]|uniref:Class I SAM-dependent DNA methyltransferase n=1 Tax=Metabacillus herbersteinensis TaxID=283816 RepID=A0ABV6G8R7_9BACI